ncbi:MAG: TldD/PmbA family protein [Bacillota bacterium]
MKRLAELTSRAKEMGAAFAEARYEDLTETFIDWRGAGPVWAACGRETGVGVRVLLNGRWGFASTTDLTPQGLQEALADALELAYAGGSGQPGEAALRPRATFTAEHVVPRAMDPRSVPLADKLGAFQRLARESLAGQAVSGFELAYADQAGERVYVDSEGCTVWWEPVRCIGRVSVTAADRGDSASSVEGFGGTVGWEAVETGEASAAARMAAANAREWLGAGEAPAGSFPVLLDNQAAENFIHEAIGHAAEGDAVARGLSVLAGKLGQQVGPPGVTVVDDPSRTGSVGAFPFDDEGTPARAVTILDRGTVAEYLHSRETARLLGAEANGHARAVSYRYPPIVRMGTIYLAPGPTPPARLVESMEEGIYLLGKRGGQVNPARGSFQFNADRALWISRGKVAGRLRGVSLSGQILDILTAVAEVGDDLAFHTGGCGKGAPAQTIPAGSGSPHVLLSRAMIGGRRR